MDSPQPRSVTLPAKFTLRLANQRFQVYVFAFYNRSTHFSLSDLQCGARVSLLDYSCGTGACDSLKKAKEMLIPYLKF